MAEPTTIAERSPLPPVLHNRVAVLMTNYLALQKETSAEVEAILEQVKGAPIQATYRFENDGLKYIVIPSRAGRGGGGGGRGGVSPEVLAQVSAIQAKIGAVAEDYGRRVVDFINEKEAIRVEIGQTLGQAKANSIDNLLAAASRVVTAKATEDSYRDYRIAVFQAGLSPEQRRLFFDSVVERLELPLPRGEPQPILRASSW